ncbi:uncharacterized protein MYCFIDRAFT_18253, partial [Pseudocercospora fijiensis CIRAD86]
FRLLDVHPSPHDEPKIICSMTHKSLGERPLPAYETISYCWGNSLHRSEVIVNGHRVSVPASTAMAIRRMRIDALCINQRDVDERTVQVSLMGEIFRHSTGNLIYLGED